MPARYGEGGIGWTYCCCKGGSQVCVCLLSSSISQAVADTVRSTLGPRGMDKLMYDGRSVTISNDGATIMRLLDIVHPAAKTLVDISLSQVRAMLTSCLHLRAESPG